MVDLLLDRRELTASETRRLLHSARPQRLRTMREFAEQEIILPDGPHRGRRFRSDRQPAARLWLDAVDSGLWRRHALTGCTQSGKSLCGLCIPAMYHLFETRETVIFGVPQNDMTNDKWKEDILPAIESSRYRDLLPSKGSGSRGGRVSAAVHFRHGVTLRFMTGGGGDKSRAAFTSRVLVVTEVDGMDESGGSSRESDKITQLEARTDAYGSQARIYLECTTSFESGRIWQEYIHGTSTRVVQLCPHCGDYVTLGREHLGGWKDADTVMEARREAHWVCPACGVCWTDDDRKQAAGGSRIVHRGQAIDAAGVVTGTAPDTDTLGFRWSAPDNLFWQAADVARREWNAQHSANEDMAEREMCQFVWALPAPEGSESMVELSTAGITSRMGRWTRGHVPDDAERLVIAADVGLTLCYWTCLAMRPDDSPHVVDYGVIEAPSRELGPERGLSVAFHEYKSLCNEGWIQNGRCVRPEWAWIDARFMTDEVIKFIREANAERAAAANPGEMTQFMPSFGFGSSVYLGGGSYPAPKRKEKGIQYIGIGYHIERRVADKVWVSQCNADAWKTNLHGRLMMPMDDPGAMTLFKVPRDTQHISFAKHLTAEKPVTEWVPGKGDVVRWVQESRNNHWGDSTYMALIAADYAARVAEASRPAPANNRPRQNRMTTPDGRAYLATER